MRTRSRTKKVSYVLQVSCDKVPEMNEKEFLQEIRDRIYDAAGKYTVGGHLVGVNGGLPRVSVVKRLEEYISVEKEKKP